MEEKRTTEIFKANAGGEQKRHRLNFVRKLVTALTAFSLSTLVALGTTACQSKTEQPAVPPVNPNPPVVTPVDPEKPDPEKPDPEKPDLETPDPETPDSEKPDDPTPDNPDDPVDDPLTQKEIIEKIIDAIEPNVQYALTENSTGFSYIALDFKQENGLNYTDALVRYTRKLAGQYVERISLVRIQMKTEMTEENLKSGAYKAINSYCGVAQAQFTCPVESEDDRVEAIYQKLLDDDAISTTLYNPDIIVHTKGSVGSSSQLNCIVTSSHFYRINEEKFTSVTLSVKSDGSTKDHILDHLINGTKDVSYCVQDAQGNEYIFSNKVIYEFNGLNNKNVSENEN